MQPTARSVAWKEISVHFDLDRLTLRPPEVADTSRQSDADVEMPSSVTPTDWHVEAQRTIESIGPELLQQEQRRCRPEPPARPPPGCTKHSDTPEWKPEPQRVGMAGLLPYVRIGKRCIVGLGFFGCAVGKLPEANGHLFDRMRDPNLPSSSVPDLPGEQSTP